jgi:hypothetical protein
VSNKPFKGPRKPQARRMSTNFQKQGPPQQSFPVSGAKQQPTRFNPGVKNPNFAQRQPQKPINNTMQNMAKNVQALQKENANLKAKLAQAQKKP